MTTRKIIALLSSTLFASMAFAADVAAPETPGSQGPRQVAEARHLALVHGIDNTVKQVAQAPGSAQAQAVAEERHLKREHGRINDSADRRMLREASRL